MKDVILRWRTPLILGVATSLLQLCVCLLVSGRGSIAATYHAFCNWDGAWYDSIVRNGYISSIPPARLSPEDSNVAFFPGFPLWAGLIAKLPLFDGLTAIAVASQIAAVFFWIVFYRTMERWTPSRPLQLATAAAVLLHPAAFFLQVGYSESLFLASLVGFLLFTTSPRCHWLAGGFTGAVLSATRIVGAPLILLAAIPVIARHRPFHERLSIINVSMIGISGFLIFCWWQWGHADLYMWTQKIGWNVQPDYLAVLKWKTWSQWSPRSFWPRQIDANEFSRLMTSLYLWILLMTALIEVAAYSIGVRGFFRRLPFYLAAAILMFVSVSGVAAVSLQSMSRYTLTVHVTWLLGFAGLWMQWPKERFCFARNALIALFLFAGAYALVLQLRFISMFVAYYWVA